LFKTPAAMGVVVTFLVRGYLGTQRIKKIVDENCVNKRRTKIIFSVGQI
jgi:hypothetical protein